MIAWTRMVTERTKWRNIRIQTKFQEAEPVELGYLLTMETESREVKDTSWSSELSNKKWTKEETWNRNEHTELEELMRCFYSNVV